VVAWQVPSPLHADFVRVPLRQLSVTQTVPLLYFLQAPAPSQNPSFPHVETRSLLHSPSGSVSVAMFPQTPSAPEPFFAAEHAWQRLPQGESQQKPSTQLPLAHCDAVVHAAATPRSG
jgi:hypothetical protein